MEPIRNKIKESLKQGIKNKDEVATSTVRLILAAIKDHDIQNRTKKDNDQISDVEILNLLQKNDQAKTRKCKYLCESR